MVTTSQGFTRREVEGEGEVIAVWENGRHAIVETADGRFSYVQPRVYRYRSLEQCGAAIYGMDEFMHSVDS